MIGENIRYLRKCAGISQAQLAERLEIKQASVSLWESGKTSPDRKYLVALSSLFGVSVDYLLSDIDLPELDSIRIKRNAVPIVGEIACGHTITAEQNIEGYADLPDGIHADFALKCKGDSMLPTLHDGDIVLIRQQPEVADGQIAAVRIGNEATLKHVYRRPDGLLLVSENHKYAPILASFASGEEIIIHGLAVGYTRLFD